MYNVIYAPKGYHGTLGRRIQEELCNDRAKRAKRRLKTKIKQYTSKGVSKKKNKIESTSIGYINKPKIKFNFYITTLMGRYTVTDPSI